MNATYTTLLLGFALGLAALIPLTLALRARYKAIGYARGYRSGRAEQYTRVQHLHDEIGRQKHMRDIERQGHQQRIEAVMQDCDDRIAIYARRSNPFTADDYADKHIVMFRGEHNLRDNSRSAFAPGLNSHTIRNLGSVWNGCSAYYQSSIIFQSRACFQHSRDTLLLTKLPLQVSETLRFRRRCKSSAPVRR